ncbi:MAG: gamma-glutamyltransferase [Polyangiales bacterium]
MVRGSETGPNRVPVRRRGVWIGAAVLLSIAVIGALLLPKGPRDPMPFDDPSGQPRDAYQARQYVVVAGTPWAASAMERVLADGGNAFDAAVAGLLVLNVTYGEAASFPSIAPLLVWDAAVGKARSYVGVGTAPARASIDEFRARGHDVVPKYDIVAQLVPASPDVIIELLRKYGTRAFAELARPAIGLAEEGFPVHRAMARDLDFGFFERLGFRLLMPYNAEVFTQGQWWRPIVPGDRFRMTDLARTFRNLSEVESSCVRGGGARDDCLLAVREHFYRGPIADAIVALHEHHDGLITREDLAGYEGRWEEPLRGRFREYEVLTNGTWTQGIVVPMVLQILDGMPLRELGHNTATYVHTVVQALELAMADREAWVGDPEFAEVPIGELLDPQYALRQRERMTERAFGALPDSGVQRNNAGVTGFRPRTSRHRDILARAPRFGRDTSYLAVIDAAGNSVSMTPSDFPQSPMVPEMGLTLGIRMTQFRLDPESPTALEPGKRPRVTPHALMLLRDGTHVMSIGTPGAEMQTQANIQVLINHLVFEMGVQQAVDAPRFRCLTWPDSFAPHDSEPGVLELEATLYDAIADDLRALGYQVRRWEDWDNHFSAVGVVLREGDLLIAGSDPRDATTAAGR